MRSASGAPDETVPLGSGGASARETKFAAMALTGFPAERVIIRHQAFQPVVENMGVYLRCGNIGVAQHLLHRAEIGAMGEEMAGEGMAQNMRR